jgi:hypothetical protein
MSNNTNARITIAPCEKNSSTNEKKITTPMRKKQRHQARRTTTPCEKSNSINTRKPILIGEQQHQHKKNNGTMQEK